MGALCAWAGNVSWSFPTFGGGSRLTPISRLSPLPTLTWNRGPFPPPALPGFDGTTSLSATPHGPACPSRESSWEAYRPPLGFPVLRPISVYRHAVALTPVGPPVRFARQARTTAAFPLPLRGRLPQQLFRGLLGVHVSYGLPARGAPKGPFPSKAPAASLPPLLLRLLPAGATVAGEELHLLKIDTFHGAQEDAARF